MGTWRTMSGEYETLRVDLQFPLKLVPRDTPERTKAILAILNGALAEFGIWVTHVDILEEEKDDATDGS